MTLNMIFNLFKYQWMWDHDSCAQIRHAQKIIVVSENPNVFTILVHFDTVFAAIFACNWPLLPVFQVSQKNIQTVEMSNFKIVNDVFHKIFGRIVIVCKWSVLSVELNHRYGHCDLKQKWDGTHMNKAWSIVSLVNYSDFNWNLLKYSNDYLWSIISIDLLSNVGICSANSLLICNHFLSARLLPLESNIIASTKNVGK